MVYEIFVRTGKENPISPNKSPYQKIAFKYVTELQKFVEALVQTETALDLKIRKKA